MKWSDIIDDLGYAMNKWWPVLAIVIGFAIWTEVINPSQTERKNTVCPSYLSIARSARDTLIVMRNDSQCATYVLEHL